MTYSIIGILAAIILLIINRDVLWGADGKSLSKTKNFIAMAAAVMLWTRYVISYLEKKNLFNSILYYSGSIFLGHLRTAQLRCGG